MQFCSLDATFGNLEHRVLTFAPGLNIIEAPNESGKSTLCAFLRVMLYGLKTNERGTLADKNRYAPWSGSPMRGTLALTSGQEHITLQRDTVRANAPMGLFSAVYTGTSEPVAGLTAADCGEQLLGVPREVYERSAFIRQSGLAIDSDAELERRIAALITTGEEGPSYSETMNTLKKQLNARRHNKTGQIPALEQSIAADGQALSELRTLAAQHSSAEAELAVLRSEQDRLRQELALHDAADRQEQYRALCAAGRAAEEAGAKAEAFYRMMEASKTPPDETLEQVKVKLQALDDLKSQQAEAERNRQSAQKALDEFCACGTPPAVLNAVPYDIMFSLAAAVFCVLFALHIIPFPVFLLCCGILCGMIAVCSVVRRRQRAQRTQYDRQRSALERAVHEADAACAVLAAAQETQSAAILAEIPVKDIDHASAYIHDALSRRETHRQLVRDAQMAQLRYEVLQKQTPAGAPAQAVERPVRSRAELQGMLEENTARCSALQRDADYTAGRIRAIGDRSDLESSLAEKQRRLDALEREYSAIALAMDSLEHANTVLQNRFSPALGARAAELFAGLSGGKYRKVLLDRTLKAFAEEAGSPVSRSAALLSQGAADQLYLAVRLAICDLVLPAEKHIPLILDDALINFDDTRCAAALDLLQKEAQQRQILLFTCQRRESAYLAGKPGVSVLSLS